jgi:hypothetical protein
MSVEGRTLYDVKQIGKLKNIYRLGKLKNIYRQFILNYFSLGIYRKRKFCAPLVFKLFALMIVL